MPTFTTNYNLAKPVPFAETGVWGGLWNDNADDLDTIIKDREDEAAAAQSSADTALGYPLNIFVAWTDGVPGLSTTPWALNGLGGAVYPGNVSLSTDWVVALPIRVGQTLDAVTARVYRESGATVILRVHRNDGSGTATQLGTATSASTGWHDLTVGSLAHTVLTDNYYMATIQMTTNGSVATSAQLAGLRCT